MTENFVEELGPRGPRVQLLVHKGEGRVHTLRFPPYFLLLFSSSDSSRSEYLELPAEEARVGLTGKILATFLDISLKES